MMQNTEPMMQNTEPRMDALLPSTGSQQHAETSPPAATSPWLTIHDGAAWARCGRRQLYEAVHRGKLRAVRVGGRGELRFRREWIDAWLEAAPAKGRRRR
jgi:excisionase family DNA binding protein